MRPSSIVQFERFYLASVVVAFVNLGLSYDQSVRSFNSDPALAGAGFGSGFIIGTMAFAFVISLLFWYLIARRASNIAKWILVALTLFGTVMTAVGLSEMLEQGTIATALGLAGTALGVIAIVFLFRHDAVDWLTSSGAKGPIDTSTFE